MTSYQFVIVRYRHSASAGELVNIGMVMWVPSQRLLLHRFNERYARLSQFFPGFDGPAYRVMLRRLERHFTFISRDKKQLKLFAGRSDDVSDLLSRLMPTDESCFQWSEVMAGIAPDIEARFEELFRELITRHEEHRKRPRRSEDDSLGC